MAGTPYNGIYNGGVMEFGIGTLSLYGDWNVRYPILRNIVGMVDVKMRIAFNSW